MSSTALLKIPELRDLLSGRLSQSDLCNCVRVSKAWHRDLTPPLWSTIEIFSLPQEVAFSTPEARAAILRHRRLIRSFSASDGLVLKTLGDELLGDVNSSETLLQSPSPNDYDDRSTELRELSWLYGTHGSSLIRLVDFSPELRKLHVLGWEPEDSALIPLIGKLEHLKTLTILAGSSNLLPLADFRALLKHCPGSVETLRIDYSLKGDHSNSNADQMPLSPASVPPLPSEPLHRKSIRQLSLRGSALNIIDKSFWSSFLSRCHELRSFSVVSPLMSWNVHEIVQIMQQYCPHLEELHLTEVGRHITDAYLALFLSACDRPLNDTEGDTSDTINNNADFTPSILPQLHGQQQQGTIQRRPRWKVFEVSVLPTMGPLSSEILLAHAPSLEQIIVRDGTIMDAALQHQLLIQSPNLTTFQVIPDRSDQESTFSFDPLLLIPPPSLQDGPLWACELTLRTLWLAMHPTPLSSDQQRLVLRQLGRLHNLEELTIFNECDANHHRTRLPGFTDWSLLNGLDEMGEMKALKVVSLTGFLSACAEKERVWVFEHWPLLERMSVGGIAFSRLEGERV
ncbi:MAG: hypothetical protein J3R72DRAFT_453353 [Linnemannia gamsii]|nr:MAG: hypothetical protein J3R72DRAFT_453353 [Linnemannia gamsii]